MFLSGIICIFTFYGLITSEPIITRLFLFTVCVKFHVIVSSIRCSKHIEILKNWAELVEYCGGDCTSVDVPDIRMEL